MKRVLVTGGCGFIGSNLVRMILRDRPDLTVRNLDALSYSGNPENLADLAADERYEFVKGDIADPGTAAAAVAGCDAVLHLAAESHVDRSISGPRPFVLSNALGTQTLLEAWRNDAGADGKPFVNVSTDEVYGSLPLEDPDARFTEDSPIAPSSVYSASKAAADHFALAYATTFSMHVTTTRCSNNFGPYQFPEKVIPLFVTNLIEGRKVPLYGDGKNVRDWIHVEDHCEGILAAMDRGEPGEVYNLGADNERSNLELTHAILKAMSAGEDMIEHVADRPGHDRRYAIDSSKARRELGWTPTRSAWPDALQRTVDWYTDNREWWQRVRSGAYREYYEKQYGSLS
jgi:dTDP-glucose 4,6-dehydratase